MRSTLLLALITLALSVSAHAQVIVEPVLGQIQIDNDGIWSCQITDSQLCSSCVEDADTPRSIPPLIIAFGKSGLGGWSYGSLTGSLQLAAEIDGLTIPPALLPRDSYFTSRIGVGVSFTPINPCGGPQGLDYQINSNVGAFTESGNHEITIPAGEADLVNFEINFCNVGAHWGAGCNINGSVNDRWLLHSPGVVNASVVGPGDTAPIAFPTEGVTLDFQQGGGGTVTVMRSEVEAPGGAAPPGPAGYWELRTDMLDGSYSVDVTLEFDPATLPPEVNPAGLMIARFDRVENSWESLISEVDVGTGTVTATTDGLSKLVLSEHLVVSVQNSTWGALKLQYRSPTFSPSREP